MYIYIYIFLSNSQNILLLPNFLKIVFGNGVAHSCRVTVLGRLWSGEFFPVRKAEVAIEERMIPKEEKNCQGKVAE